MKRRSSVAPDDVQSPIRNAIQPRAIDTSGGLFDIVKAVYWQGFADG
jgi:hypothetical protein